MSLPPLSILSHALAAEIRALVESVLDERLPSIQSNLYDAKILDEETQASVNKYALLSHKPYLTRKEAAIYLSVSERSIAEWAQRAANQNPFPESYAGGEPRTRREKIDEWAERERERHRLRLAG